MKDEKSKLYSYALIGQRVHERNKSLWEKCGKYKRLIDAEKAIKDAEDRVMDIIYRIVPYFEGHWWRDEVMRMQEYFETNSLLWDYLTDKGLKKEAQKVVSEYEPTYSKFLKTHPTYKNYDGEGWYMTALESFNSRMESLRVTGKVAVLIKK